MLQSFFHFLRMSIFALSFSAVVVTGSSILITQLTCSVAGGVRPRCQVFMTPHPPSPNPCECITRSVDGLIMRRCRTIFLSYFPWKVSLTYHLHWTECMP